MHETTPETWLPVPGWDRYEVSNYGRVRSLDHTAIQGNRTLRVKGRVLRASHHKSGYRMVQLCGPGTRRHIHVHRLVAWAFLGPQSNRVVRHLNGDGSDNRAENLTYGTESENAYDRVRHGNHPGPNTTHCPAGHEYTPENTYCRPSRPNHRECRACRPIHSREYRRRRAAARANEHVAS